MYFICGCVIGFLGLCCLELVDSNDKLSKKLDNYKNIKNKGGKHHK